MWHKAHVAKTYWTLLVQMLDFVRMANTTDGATIAPNRKIPGAPLVVAPGNYETMLGSLAPVHSAKRRCVACER